MLLLKVTDKLRRRLVSGRGAPGIVAHAGCRPVAQRLQSHLKAVIRGTFLAKDRTDSTPAPTARRSEPARRRRAPRSTRSCQRARSARAAAGAGRARAADLRPRCHHEPPADRGTPPAGCRREMFREAAAIGGPRRAARLLSRLRECRASPWVSQAERLGELMTPDRLPRRPHADRQGARPCAPRDAKRPRCRRWCSSATPWRRSVDDLCRAAGELGLLGVPAFMFQEGDDAVAEQAFREIARLTEGAYCRFDPGAAR